MSSIYNIKTQVDPSSALIFLNEREIGTLTTRTGGASELVLNGETMMNIVPKVDGEIRPFSLSIDDKNGIELLKIKYGLFLHNHRMYMIGNVPESKNRRDILTGPKYISHLLNFPISTTEGIDHEVRSQIRRYRGILVGEITGIGSNGHEVKLADELDDIGLPLSVSCYLLYTTPHGKRLSFEARMS